MLLQIIAGLAIGILIGVLSGIVFLSMLRLVVKARKLKEVVAIAAQLLSLPTFWFGGPWLGNRLMQSLKWESLLPYYLLGLAVVFLLLISGPLIAYIHRIRLAIKSRT